MRALLFVSIIIVGLLFVSGCSDTYLIKEPKYYGSIHDRNTSGMLVSIPSSGVYYNITLLTPKVKSSELKGFTYNENKTTLIVNYTGLYNVFAHISTSGGNNQFYGVALGVNYDESIGKLYGCYDMRTTTTISVGGFTFQCLIRLNRGDILNLRVDDEAGTTADLLVRTYTLTAIMEDK